MLNVAKEIFRAVFVDDAPGPVVFLISTAITYETVMYMLS